MEGLLTLLTKIFAFLQKVLASLACFVHNLFIFVATLLFTTLKSYLKDLIYPDEEQTLKGVKEKLILLLWV